MGVIDTTAQANHDANHDVALQRFLAIRCPQCVDSYIEIGLYGPQTCTRCDESILSPAAKKIAEVIVDRIARERSLDLQMIEAARSLANATFKEPVPGVVLQNHLRCSRRQLSSLMQALCDEWGLPAVASRQPPYGYYIAVTADQLDAWARGMRSQAISELVRIHHLKRICYPLLAGQRPLDFISQITSELQEAIR